MGKANVSTKAKTLQDTVNDLQDFIDQCSWKTTFWKVLYFVFGFVVLVANIVIANYMQSCSDEPETIKVISWCIVGSTIFQTALGYFGFYSRLKYNSEAENNATLLKDYFDARIGIFKGKSQKDLNECLSKKLIAIKKKKFTQESLINEESQEHLNNNSASPQKQNG